MARMAAGTATSSGPAVRTRTLSLGCINFRKLPLKVSSGTHHVLGLRTVQRMYKDMHVTLLTPYNTFIPTSLVRGEWCHPQAPPVNNLDYVVNLLETLRARPKQPRLRRPSFYLRTNLPSSISSS